MGPGVELFWPEILSDRVNADEFDFRKGYLGQACCIATGFALPLLAIQQVSFAGFTGQASKF